MSKRQNIINPNTPSERLVPLLPIEIFYRSLRSSGSSENRFRSVLRQLAPRYGPKEGELLCELFRRSIRHCEAYGNVGEAFYPRRFNTRSSDSPFANRLVAALGVSKKIELMNQSFDYVDYEIAPFRTTRSCTEKGGEASSSGAGGIDLLLASNDGSEVLPAIGEIKANSETVGPTFALIQTLAYAAQLTTRNQFLRLKAHYPRAFGALNEDRPMVEIVILLQSPIATKIDEDLRFAISLSCKVRENLKSHLRQVTFLKCACEHGVINCETILA